MFSFNLLGIYWLLLLYLSEISRSVDREGMVRNPDYPVLLSLLNDTFVNDLNDFSKYNEKDIRFANNTTSSSISSNKFATHVISALQWILSAEFE